MQKIILTIFILLSGLGVYAQQCPIIPLPQDFKKASGALEINSSLPIIVSDAALNPAAYYLQKEVLRYTGISLSIQPEQDKPCIKLELNKRKKDTPEAYQLNISEDGASLSADSPNGVFNAAVSLLQLIRQADGKNGGLKIGCWKIKDSPLYSWRGIMLDESRHFFGMDAVKQILDWMAFYKLNRFHWHLTDTPGWRIEIKKYPKLTLIGGIGNKSNPLAPAQYYTQEEIKEIVQYAAERYIEVIPEIDMPGHAAAANRAYPQFSGGGSLKHPDFTFNPGKDSTYQYLTDILKETDVLFPSKMIHLGGDEVHFGNEKWNTDPAVQNLMKEKNLPDLKAVEYYFIQRMADSVLKLNSKVLGWDEVVNASLPSRKTVIFWWRHDRPESLKTALDKGYEAVLCPRIPLYFDFVQDSTHLSGRRWKDGEFSTLKKVYSFSNSTYPSVITEKNEQQVLGIQANLWTETISSESRLEYMLFPRISALAEAAWTKPEMRNFSGFESRLKPQLNLYHQEGILYFSPFNKTWRPEIIDIFKNETIE